jgi:hypothetical protein
MPSSSSAKQAKQTSNDAARAVPFSRINGRPTRHHYKELKKEAANLASKVDDITFDWSRDTATGDEYAKINVMTMQIKILTKAVATLTKAIATKENVNPNGGGDGSNGGGGDGGQQPFAYTRNMGAYCFSCGFHPMGANHNSTMCIKKKDNHKDGATWSKHMGSDKFWPKANRVKPNQQRHVSYKDRSAPI